MTINLVIQNNYKILMEPHSETLFYQDSGVTVTPSRYVNQSKTYAMRNISSVHIFEIVKSRVKAIFLIILGLPFLFTKDILWLGLIMIGLGIWWLITTKMSLL